MPTWMIVWGAVLFFGGILGFAFCVGSEIGRAQKQEELDILTECHDEHYRDLLEAWRQLSEITDALNMSFRYPCKADWDAVHAIRLLQEHVKAEKIQNQQLRAALTDVIRTATIRHPSSVEEALEQMYVAYAREHLLRTEEGLGDREIYMVQAKAQKLARKALGIDDQEEVPF
mgnify:CR=1 FL=1